MGLLESVRAKIYYMKLFYLWTVAFFVLDALPTVAQVPTLGDFPKVDVKIAIDSDSYKDPNAVHITITITNKLKSKQRILFGGKSWGLCGQVSDKQGNSVTQLQCRSVLESQVYTETMLKKIYRYLKPGRSLSATYYLTQIIVINFANNNQLPPGDYSLSISYFNNDSNKVDFTIRR